LLADADVRAVLGVTVKERQPGAQQAHGLLLSQCYLGTGTPRSVSIAVAGNTRSGSKTLTPRAFWRDQFHGRDEHASGRKGEKRQHERKPGELAGNRRTADLVPRATSWRNQPSRRKLYPPRRARTR